MGLAQSIAIASSCTERVGEEGFGQEEDAHGAAADLGRGILICAAIARSSSAAGSSSSTIVRDAEATPSCAPTYAQMTRRTRRATRRAAPRRPARRRLAVHLLLGAVVHGSAAFTGMAASRCTKTPLNGRGAGGTTNNAPSSCTSCTSSSSSALLASAASAAASCGVGGLGGEKQAILDAEETRCDAPPTASSWMRSALLDARRSVLDARRSPERLRRWWPLLDGSLLATSGGGGGRRRQPPPEHRRRATTSGGHACQPAAGCGADRCRVRRP